MSFSVSAVLFIALVTGPWPLGAVAADASAKRSVSEGPGLAAGRGTRCALSFSRTLPDYGNWLVCKNLFGLELQASSRLPH
jgi:hypothetical protein